MSVDPMYLCMNQSTHGSTVRRCMENGVWSETDFECTGVNFWTLCIITIMTKWWNVVVRNLKFNAGTILHAPDFFTKGKPLNFPLTLSLPRSNY